MTRSASQPPLGPGSRLGPYEITAKLGEGGMGEVYRATDSNLHRDVAIKVLPAAFTEDAERLARFEREAQLLAQLQHPNIASIYGLEESAGGRALILELVEGPTLAERIARGPMSMEDAVTVARRIAAALEAAHEKGIVHRDLKPANVKVDDEERVKVLDFGLAKAMAEESGIQSASQLAHSPTITHGATVEGVILGTAAYMAPEQAKGKPVDKRADIWAFGVVLFEMLVGRRLFEAETLPETLGAVFRQPIDLDELPADTPRRLRRLLERCLERDPKLRLRDIGEARIALDAIASGAPDPAEPPVEPRRRGLVTYVLPLALAALALAAGWFGGSRSSRAVRAEGVSTAVTEFSFWVDDLVGAELSPDGQRIAWIAPEGETRVLWARDLDDRTPRRVLEDRELTSALWSSPDRTEFAAQIGDRLFRVNASSGERRLVAAVPELEDVPFAGILDGVWLEDDTLIFAVWRGGVYRVPARGGSPELLIPIDPETEIDVHELLLLSDGETLLLRVHRHGDESSEPGWRIESYRDGERKELGGSSALGEVSLVGTSGDTLLVAAVDEQTPSVWGVPIDPARGEISGQRFLVLSDAEAARVGSDGTIVYAPRQPRPAGVVRLDGTGAESEVLGRTHPSIFRAALSPDGSRLALVLETDTLWVHDLRRDTLTRLVEEESFIEDPQWTPDGRTIYYSRGNDSLLRRIRAEPGAVAETVLEQSYRGFLAPDGRGILYRFGGFRLSPRQGFYWVPFDADGRPGEERKLLGGVDSYGRISPNGGLLAYGQGVDGRREAFLTTFPAIDQTIQLSSNGGGTPQWSALGDAVYYTSSGGLVEVMVSVDASGRLVASPERRLFDFEAVGVRPGGWTVAPDGRGFLFVKDLDASRRNEVVVIRNGLQRAMAMSR